VDSEKQRVAIVKGERKLNFLLREDLRKRHCRKSIVGPLPGEDSESAAQGKSNRCGAYIAFLTTRGVIPSQESQLNDLKSQSTGLMKSNIVTGGEEKAEGEGIGGLRGCDIRIGRGRI